MFLGMRQLENRVVLCPVKLSYIYIYTHFIVSNNSLLLIIVMYDKVLKTDPFWENSVPLQICFTCIIKVSLMDGFYPGINEEG